MAAEEVNILDLVAPVPTFEPGFIRQPHLAASFTFKFWRYLEDILLISDGPVSVDSAAQRFFEGLSTKKGDW